MEQWDLYNIHREKLPHTATRDVEPLKPDEFHLVVNVCIINSNNEMLIQQRQSFKKGWANMWDVTSAGSAVFGDTSQQAASRELFEEVGLQMDFTNVRPKFTINFDKGFADYYLVEADIDINTCRLQQEEVQAVKWASKETIFQMIEEGTFIPYYKGLVDLIFESVHHYGSVHHARRAV